VRPPTRRRDNQASTRRSDVRVLCVPPSLVSPRPNGFTRFNRRFVSALTRGRGSTLLRPYPYGWFDGGCWSLARGVKDWINPRRAQPLAAYAVLAERVGSAHVVLHHVLIGLTTTNGILYVDGDGVADESALLRRWRDREQIAAPFLTPLTRTRSTRRTCVTTRD